MVQVENSFGQKELWRLYSEMIKANGCEHSLTNLTQAFETKNYDKVEECLLKIEDTK